MKKLFSILLAFTLCVICFPADADDEIDVTKYSYTIIPVLNPFNNCLYVKTDNPDPLSFRFIDEDSIYAGENDQVMLSQKKALYADVKYEDPSRYRVKDGYIFESSYYKSDGGQLTLQQRETYQYYYNGTYETGTKYVNTGITVSCPRLKNGLDALIDQYITSGMSFFEKLDALQAALDKIAIYPRSVRDSESPNQDRPWPFLAASPYAELSLNEHYEMFNSHAGGMLLQKAYPYILDSAGFPGMISSAAKQFEPECTVEYASNHWERAITWNGETRIYGGAGKGGYDPIYSDRLEQIFCFDGTASDWSVSGTVDSYSDKLASYETVAAEDAEQYRDLINGNTFRETIKASGGTWIRVASEGGFDYGEDFSYLIPTISGGRLIIEDAWVDGRYIGTNNTFVPGVHFSDHPLAGIVIPNMRYTDIKGNEHTQDVLFTYVSSRDRWEASGNYFYAGYYGQYQIPDSFILTHDQVNSMSLDGNTFSMPKTGLNYNGKKQPGSTFQCVTVIYHGENGLEGPAAMKIDFADLNEPYVLAGGGMLKPPAYPAGQSFKAWLIDGEEYPAGGSYIPTGDFSASALWKNLNAYLSSSYIQVKAACEDGFTGTLYCAYYNRSGKLTAVESKELSPGENNFQFYWRNRGAVKAKIIVVNEKLQPLYPVEEIQLN